MDLLFEILFDVYIELMMFIVPEKHTTSKKYRYLSILIASIVLLGVLALFIWGCVLLIDYNNKLGVIPIVFAICLSIVQFVFGVIIYNKKSK